MTFPAQFIPLDAGSVKVTYAFRYLGELKHMADNAVLFQRDDALKELAATEGLSDSARRTLKEVTYDNARKAMAEITADFDKRSLKLLKKASGSLAKIAEGK